MPNEPWKNITISCSNYRKDCLGHSEYVTINKEGICQSGCEAVWCPLHRSETHTLPEKPKKTIDEFFNISEFATFLKTKAAPIPTTNQRIINEFIFEIFGVKTYNELVRKEI